MFAPQQGVQKAHSALSQRAKSGAGLLISYFNASSKAFEQQRYFRFGGPVLVVKARRVGNQTEPYFGSTLRLWEWDSRLVANQFTASAKQL
jgi:hypothetical protein